MAKIRTCVITATCFDKRCPLCEDLIKMGDKYTRHHKEWVHASCVAITTPQKDHLSIKHRLNTDSPEISPNTRYQGPGSRDDI